MVRFVPDIWFALTILGLLLVSLEFCFPGTVVAAAIGSVLALGGTWRLFHLGPDAHPHLLLVAPLTAMLALAVSALLRIAAAGRARKRNVTGVSHYP